MERPRCWEGLRAGGEGDDRRWDGWVTSPTQWTWVWANSRRWWRTRKTGLLQPLGSQSVGHDWATGQQHEISVQKPAQILASAGFPGAKAVGGKPQCLAGGWKAVTVFCHRDLSTGCLSVLVTWLLVFPGVSEPTCFLTSPWKSQTVTLTYSYAMEGVTGEGIKLHLSQTICGQSTHNKVMQEDFESYSLPGIVQLYIWTSNKGQTLKGPVLEPSHPWSGPCGSCQEGKLGNGFLETPSSGNGIWLKLHLWCNGNAIDDFQKRESIWKKLKFEIILIILYSKKYIY